MRLFRLQKPFPQVNILDRLVARRLPVLPDPSVDPVLVEYAKASGKPFLAYEGEEDRVDRYTEFYRSLLGEDDD